MMPSFRKKVAGFIRQFSNPGTCALESEEEAKSPSAATTSFILQYLNGEVEISHPEILCSRSFQELPSMCTAPLSRLLCAAYTGPGGGLTRVGRRTRRVDATDPNLDFVAVDGRRGAQLAQPEDLEEFLGAPEQREDDRWRHCLLNATKSDVLANRMFNHQQRRLSSGPTATTNATTAEGEAVMDDYLQQQEEEGEEELWRGAEGREVAGLSNWRRPHRRAYGMATTLYERHPVTQRNAGEPIADAFAICARANNAVLVLADGVNWGEKSCLAARCAVHGCVEYINRTAFGSSDPIRCSKDVFVILLRSLFAAHNLILQEDGMLTTLCVAMVCPLANSDNFVVCTCNVGDSLAYVYNKRHGVREITQGSHDIHSMRDMRDALGALGPVDGPNPELNNLTCSMTVVEAGDVVFLTSDGITDNFDPVVGKFAIPKEDNNNRSRDKVQSAPQGVRRGGQRNGYVEEGPPPPSVDPNLPVVEAHQRHALTLLRMEDLLNNGVSVGDAACDDAKSVCDALLDFAYKLTVAKRRILEDPELYVTGEEYHSAVEQKLKRKRLGEKLSMVPGKLDHASVVAYQVGVWPMQHQQQQQQQPATREEEEGDEEEEEEEEEEQLLSAVPPAPAAPSLAKGVTSLSMVCHSSQLKTNSELESRV